MIKLKIDRRKNDNGITVETMIQGDFDDIMNELSAGTVDIINRLCIPLNQQDRTQVLPTFVTSVYENTLKGRI